MDVLFLGTLSGLMAGRREKKLERREAKSRKAFADVRGPVRGVQMPIYAFRIPEMPRVQVPTTRILSQRVHRNPGHPVESG